MCSKNKFITFKIFKFEFKNMIKHFLMINNDVMIKKTTYVIIDSLNESKTYLQ